jgi:hypothetical protein
MKNLYVKIRQLVNRSGGNMFARLLRLLITLVINLTTQSPDKDGNLGSIIPGSVSALSL